MSLDFPPPVIPDGASIMEQFKIAAGHMLKVLSSNPKMVTGVVNMIRPDGSQPAAIGFTGDKAVSVPWGLNIDGNDDVWIGNFWGRGVVLMAGDNTTGHPAGTKAGDAIHVFKGGSIQMLTDVSIDPAGDVWAANNWNDLNGAAAPDPARPTSTWGGGSGITVIYGVASPVQPPRMGKVNKL
jgi:ethanolamine utilization protein EutQ (cupin superfamily)